MNYNIDMRIVNAESFLERFCGLMLKKNADYAMLFRKCTSVHTFFMRFNLDIVYLDKDDNIVKIIKNLKPWRTALPVKNTVSILEIPSDILKDELKPGDKIIIT